MQAGGRRRRLRERREDSARRPSPGECNGYPSPAAAGRGDHHDMDRASAASGRSRPHLPPADRRRRGERGTRARGIRCFGATKRRPLPRPGRSAEPSLGGASRLLPADPRATSGPSPAPPAARPVHAPLSHAAFPAPPSRDVAFGTKEPSPDGGRTRPLPKPDGLPTRRRTRPSAPRVETPEPTVAGRRARLRSFRAEARRAAGDGQPIRWPPPCSASPCRIRS